MSYSEKIGALATGLLACLLLSSVSVARAQIPGAAIAISGINLSTSPGGACADRDSLSTTCFGAEVRIDGRAIPLISATPTRLLALVPGDLAGETPDLEVFGPGGKVLTRFDVTPAGSEIVSLLESKDGGLSSETVSLSLPAAGRPRTSSGALTIGAGPSLGNYYQGTVAIANLSPSGGTPPYRFSVVSGALPSDCVFESGDTLLANASGSYNLVCTPQNSGVFNFTLMVADSAGNTGTKSLSITIAPYTLFTSTSLPDGSVGTAYSQSILVWDNSATPTISVTSGSTLPAGLSLANGVLTGTPASAGTYSFKLTISDSSGIALNSTYSLTISTITIGDPQELAQQAIVNLPFSHSFSATGGGAGKTWSATGLPSGFSLSTGGILSGTATAAFRNRIVVSVTDGSSTVSRAFEFIGRANSPTVLDYTLSGMVMPDAILDQNYSYGLVADGGIPPYAWTLASGSIPPGLNLLHGNSILPPAATPGATQLDGAPSAAGKYTFTLTVTDTTGATCTRTFWLNVTPMAIVPGGLTTPVTNQLYNLQLPVTGGTAPYSFTYTPTGIATDMFPKGLTASASGLISGTPLTTGSFGFSATVTDSASPAHTFTTSYSYSVNNASGLRVTTSPPYDSSVGQSFSLSLTTNGSSTYTWSLTSGSLPAGVSLSGSTIGGVPSVPGTYTFTVQATDNNTPSNTAQRIYTWVVSPMQVISEIPLYLPVATANSAYSYQLKVAGGTPPYLVTESSLYPLPAGLTLSGSGLLSGTPTQTGQFTLYQVVTDNTGIAMKSPGVYLSVIAPGGTKPLWVDGGSGSHNVTVGKPYFTYLDQILEGTGTPPFTWTVASGSSLPPGFSLYTGSSSAISLLGGSISSSGTFPVNLVVTDAAGQVGYYSVSYATYASLFASDTPLLNGVVGSAYSTTVGIAGGTPPLGVQSTGDLPPGLVLSSSGVLSGTPQFPGLFDVHYSVTDSSTPTPVSLGRANYLIVDRNGEAPGLNLGTSNLQLSYYASAAAPASTPVSITTTTGSHAFNVSLGGIPGATLSATSGITPANVNIQLSSTGVSTGAYNGVLAIDSPDAVYPNWVPVTLTVLPAPVACQVNQNGGPGIADVQKMIDESLGAAQPVNDLNGDGRVNAVDIQIVLNAALNLGCAAHE